jgi:FkbM family methyltransferase
VPYFSTDRDFLDYWEVDAGDLRFVWKLLKPGMTFLDVGANQGVYSVIAGKKVVPGGQVVAFEPSPREYRRLQLNCCLNGQRSTKTERLAVGVRCGSAAFFQVVAGDTSRNGLRPPASTDEVAEIAVRSTTLDSYMKDSGLHRVDLIKLDAEGGELDVIQGAEYTISQYHPIFICEVLDIATKPWGYSARSIIEGLEARGYDWFSINENGSITRHLLLSTYPKVRNYVAIPQHKSAEVEARVEP